MNSDRWHKIEVLYTAALQVDAADREALVEEQCVGDESLKREILSLLDSAQRQDSFMEEPDASLALEVLRSECTGLVGETISRYRIVEVLGHGGMGDVYLAHDSSLNRKVALKLLPATITDNRLRVLRFQQEARAASAISHPNVAHIYEIGEADGRHYIAMEYVNGATVRDLLNTAALDEVKILEIAKQVCHALGAAHRAGVIHRDIKPENIVVTDDGHLKVLDFGLAKLIEEVRDESEFQSGSNLQTQPELLMGTWQYMSPEQIRRQLVDCRTDLWSLGVVLFELLLHRRPFSGNTMSEIIVAILEHEPDIARSELLSVELRSVLLKLLQKDLHDRYHSAEELLRDLESIHSAGNGVRKTVTTDSARPITIGARIDTISHQVKEAPRRRVTMFRRLSMIVPLGLLLVSGSYFAFKYWSNTRLLDRRLNLRLDRLDLSADLDEIVISPDGKYVAYTVVESGKHSIRVRELATTSDLRVTPKSDLGYSGLSFSPDGNFVYYLENHAETGNLYRVAKLGGAHKLILENVNTPVSFSPDGSQMAFVRTNNAIAPIDLMIASANGESPAVLVRRTVEHNRFFASDMYGPGPVWSPDGRRIACVTHGVGSRVNEVSLEVIDVESRVARPVNAGPWPDISRLTWLADGSGWIIAASDTPENPGQLYLVGEQATRRITNDPNHYTLVSGSRDSSVLVTRKVERITSMWRLSLNESVLAAISVEQKKGLVEVERGTNDRLIQSIFDGKHINLWVQEGNTTRQLTFEADNSKATISPDGRYLVFCSTRAGALNIWRINSDGTQPLQLTNGSYEDLPSVSADSKWIIYRTGIDVRRVSINGGPAQTLLNREVQAPALSPDGRLLAFFVNDGPDSQWRIEIYDLKLGSIVKRFAVPESTSPFKGLILTSDNCLRWTPDGKGLAYVSRFGDASNIWLQPLDGAPFRKLTDFKDAEISSFAWTEDGQGIVLVQDTRAYVPVLVRWF